VNLHPRLLVEASSELEPGLEIDLASGMTIGRGPQNGLSVPDAFVSHMHARIFRRGQFLHIEDLGSTNGTYLNGRRIEREAQLRVRDEIRIGETILRYEE
jgi:pSer/pThr/pTyr-binding forkhead associated (FHA) protein